MALELFAALAAAFCLGGVALILRKITGQRLPRWIVPVAAGLGMIGFTVWNEYTWFPRATAGLPDGVVVTVANADSAVWRPWTYVVPVTTRFAALDLRAPLRNDAQPGRVMVPMVLVQRWVPSVTTSVVFDCTTARRADLMPGGARLGADGAVIGATWLQLAPDDPILTTACDGG